MQKNNKYYLYLMARESEEFYRRTKDDFFKEINRLILERLKIVEEES